jgi:hypothetical protein
VAPTTAAQSPTTTIDPTASSIPSEHGTHFFAPNIISTALLPFLDHVAQKSIYGLVYFAD